MDRLPAHFTVYLVDGHRAKVDEDSAQVRAALKQDSIPQVFVESFLLIARWVGGR
jgi:hypothetical protein